MGNKGSQKVSKKNSEKGLTTIELLIAMTIFLIVVASVYGVLKIGNISRTTINTRSENIKNVRMAINTIGREAVNAGLGYNRIGGTVPDDFTSENFGLIADEDNDDDLLTAISSGFNISESDLSKTGERNDVVAFAFRDFQFNDGFPIIINDAKEENGSLVLKTPNGACANCRPYDLFLIESGDGKKAIILSTDIVNNNTIVLGGDDDPININYGKKSKKNAQQRADKAQKDLDRFQRDLDRFQDDLAKAVLKGDLKKVADLQRDILRVTQDIVRVQAELTAALLALGGSSPSDGSAVKKCPPGDTSKCINYSSTTVVAKKIYLVSYSIGADGTLVRTTFGNNTGGDAEEQILKQPIANGVRSFKIKYLLSDGTVTEDPSVANTQKERCNEIIQLDVTVVVDSETGSSEPVTLTSTFSTRNLKYDVY